MRTGRCVYRFGLALFGLGLAGCTAQSEKDPALPIPIKASPINTAETGIRPHILAGDVPAKDQTALKQWIEETITLMQSPSFEANFQRASDLYPQVYISKTQDIIPSEKLLERLKTQDPHRRALWWPKTTVVLSGEAAVRSPNRLGFGFEASRRAATRPNPLGQAPAQSGQIELGRLHFARYTRGDPVEKSCAINTMAHEISHTLSDRADQFWMHILDSQANVTPPSGVFEAGYFVGTVAQCSYLQSIGRIAEAEFDLCLLTFSDPDISSRFKSTACDDFPKGKAITPAGRLFPSKPSRP